WPITDLAELNEAALRAAFERADGLDFFLIGAGRDPWALPEDLRQKFREVLLSVDAMATGAAVRTYNILLAENRRVGAGLIAVN
ncbi:MAG: Mth938-like domain-containing protein, partial [Pseudolabrys sp.]